METNNLTPEQISEVNERVHQIISTFKKGLENSSAFDLRGHWQFALDGNYQMSDACKYVHETKRRIISMIDKEEMLVCREFDSSYEKNKRKAKDKIITSLMNLLRPALRGRDSEHTYFERVVNISEFALNTGEDLCRKTYK